MLTIHIYAPSDARHFPREVPEPPSEKESIREEVKEKKANLG